MLSTDLFNQSGSARPALLELKGDISARANGPNGFWANVGPELFGQFLRPPEPFKAAVLYVSEVANADTDTASNLATTVHGRADARIIRALRDSETEATPVVINSDGANNDGLLVGPVRNRPTGLASEPDENVVMQTTSSPGDPRPDSDEEVAWSSAKWSDDDERLAIERPVPTTQIELLASFIPFDRETIDHAIDELLSGLETLEGALPSLEQTKNLVPHALLGAAALTAAEIVRRKLRRDADDSEEVMDTSFPGLPGFPNHWAADEL
jgi:hypothetical protein